MMMFDGGNLVDDRSYMFDGITEIVFDTRFGRKVIAVNERIGPAPSLSDIAAIAYRMGSEDMTARSEISEEGCGNMRDYEKEEEIASFTPNRLSDVVSHYYKKAINKK